MSISNKTIKKFKAFSPEVKKRLCKTCWSDKTSANEVFKEFGIFPNEIEKFMRFYLSSGDFKRWSIRGKRRFTQRSKKAALLKQLERSEN